MTTSVDRPVDLYEIVNPAYPLPPPNAMVIPPYQKGKLDVRWDDPSVLVANSKYDVLGVNVYRSSGGPYTKINSSLVGATFYRDQDTDVAVVDEDVSNRFLTDQTVAGEYILRPVNFPITRPGTGGLYAHHPTDVTLKINGTAHKVAAVHGAKGEVVLNVRDAYNIQTGKIIKAVVPGGGDVVLLSYNYTTNVVQTSIATRRTTYKATTVVTDPDDAQSTIETPLDVCPILTQDRVEQTDWVWAEAIRRNAWILEQGGEQVKVFLRRFHGTRCSCWSVPHKQAENDCSTCYGTGWVGGYDGPHEVYIGPRDSERSRGRTERGITVGQTEEVWTGPSPLVSQRDFLVRQNGDRYTIGAVRLPSNRGAILQQHFNISLLPENDIRYSVAIDISDAEFPMTADVGPMITDNDNVDPSRQRRGRSKAFENITS